VPAAAFRFSSVRGAIEVMPTAPEPVRKKPAALSKGKRDDAIRQLLAVVLCMPPEIADTAPEADA
jgi:hypothetical protein